MPELLSSDQFFWIPTSSSLPTPDVPVLGWNGRCHAVWIYAVHRSGKHWHSLSGANFKQDITHWMPLPEPPK